MVITLGDTLPAEGREAGPEAESRDLALEPGVEGHPCSFLSERVCWSALGGMGGNLSPVVQNLEMDPAPSPLLLTARTVPLSH